MDEKVKPQSSRRSGEADMMGYEANLQPGVEMLLPERSEQRFGQVGLSPPRTPRLQPLALGEPRFNHSRELRAGHIGRKPPFSLLLQRFVTDLLGFLASR